MVKKQGVESYLNTSVDTMDGGKLIVLLYEKLEDHLRTAIEQLNSGDMSGKGEAILKSQDIVMELLSSLNLKIGEIALNLQAIYLFMFKELNRINLEKDSIALEKVLLAILELKSAWVEITGKRKHIAAKSTCSEKQQKRNLAVVV
ncbi:flagellar protein FliS [bacterium BMS3Abin05]|nr:flagellar protein FliS [bacterium BMS3Abin05]GBE28874.1 flagellar protein FliS [bacterium BMS3Bbin03]